MYIYNIVLLLVTIGIPFCLSGVHDGACVSPRSASSSSSCACVSSPHLPRVLLVSHLVCPVSQPSVQVLEVCLQHQHIIQFNSI